MADHHESQNSMNLLWIIASALGIWGVYLAVGATGVFSQTGTVDLRKFFVVAACSAAFLLFWFWNQKFNQDGFVRSQAVEHQRNLLCLSSLCLNLLAYLFWGIAYLLDDPVSTQIGYVSAGCIFLGILCAMIGLSDRQRNKGKWAGLTSIVLFLAACLLFLLQVILFVNRHR